ncbi:MAG: hypothetical protein Q9167_005566 [Letrouitia subvulpina]
MTALYEHLPKTIDETRGDSSASESEHQQALEVVFDDDRAYRRKSSMVSTEQNPKLDQQPAKKQKNTSCFVHQLLESQQKSRIGHKPLLYDEDRNMDKTSDIRAQDVHSRLLTKRQLSEMALGVRELSKKLGSIRLRLNVQNIFILTKAHDEGLIGELVAWLLSKERDTQYTVYVENTLEKNAKFAAQELVSNDPMNAGRLKFWTNELCAKHPQTFDFAITLGGDGTILYASWLFQRVVPPIFSFALGSLGFLTKFDFTDYKNTLTSAFRDGVTVSLRLRFEATVMRTQNLERQGGHDLVDELVGAESDNRFTHKPDGSHEILNDIVVDRGPNPSTLNTNCVPRR